MPRLSPRKTREEASAPVQDQLADSMPAILAPSPDDVPGEFDTNVLIEKATEVPYWVDEQMPKLEAFLKESDSFLKQRYTIRDMSVEIDIPQHHLSYLLNRVYNMRFNDFVNSMRIEYIRKRVFTGDGLKQMTLEGLAKEAGFTNRTTFIRVVQKLTGRNPSDYFTQDAGKNAIVSQLHVRN